jgi:hypothetical protein
MENVNHLNIITTLEVQLLDLYFINNPCLVCRY